MYSNQEENRRINEKTESNLLLLHLAKKKWKYFTVSLIFGIFCSIIFKLFILQYESTGSFYVNDMSVMSSSNVDLKGFENIAPSENILRIFKLVNSSYVRQHLIKKFDLVHHYNIDTTREFYNQKTEKILSENILAKKTPFNTITITVTDKYRYLCADMVNEIIVFIDEMNKAYYINNVTQKLKISESYLANIQKDNLVKSKNIDSLLNEMHRLANLGSKSSSTFYILQQEERLSTLVNELYYSTRDLINSQKLYNLAIEALNQKNNKTLTIIENGIPAYRSTIYQAVLYGCLISITVFCLLIFRAYFNIHYKKELELFFSIK